MEHASPRLSDAYNNDVQAFQTLGYVVLLNEMIHDTRITPLDGRPHLLRHVRSWLGDSWGHWEGDTLSLRRRILAASEASEVQAKA